MSEINITIIETKMIDKGNLKALISFKLNDSEFYSWRIIQEENKKAWVSSPQESWDGEDGKKRYKPLIKFKAGLHKAISEALLNEYNNHL